ncbi:histidine phosphatase family protein [Glaciecola sp. SC05]|uniref:histidine phosphatase family protein n=1 Tax=Glaciecola sp. SC05 TaxID=1987355 RepID=UPI003528A695
MAELFLVRHGQASFGSANYDKLSELGHQQSQHLGDYFASRGIVFDRTITGDMVRHRETAQGIVGSLDSAEIDTGWNEFDFNAVVSAYLSVHPEQQPAKGAPRSDWYRVLKLAMLAWSEEKLPDLDEDWQGFETRVHNAAQAVFKSSDKKVLVVSSGGAIAVCFMQMLGLQIQKAIDFNLQIKNTSVHHVFFNKNSAQLSSFNNVPHLDHPERQHLITYS